MRGEYLAGDLLGRFAGETEARGRAVEQLAPEIVRGELVEGEIAAHGGERLGVLAQALGLERRLGEAPARKVPLARVYLPDPALVLPGAAAYENALRGQRPQAHGQAIAVERAGILEQRAYQIGRA